MRTSDCFICGGNDDVRTGIVEWLHPEPGEDLWTSLPRCFNRQACRDRFEAAATSGETWPCRDHTRSSKPVRVPVRELEPEPASEEARPWSIFD